MKGVVVVAPHMDDEVLGCGGLLQRFDNSKVIFVTESKRDRRRTTDGYVEYDGSERIREMEKVSELLWFSPVRLGYDVHSLDTVPLAELIGRLEQEIHGAELVLVPALSNDEDHNVVSRACRALRRPHFGSFSILEYQTWGTPGPMECGLILPLKWDELERKMEAMKLYATQTAPGGAYDELYPYSAESVETWARAAGRLAHAEAAEAFTPIRLLPNKTTSLLLS